MHCVAEAEVRYRSGESIQGVHGVYAHLDAKDMTTSI